MTWILAFVTTFAALRSAWYWYKSSQIYAVPDWVEVGRDEPKDPLQVQLGWMNALMKASGESAVLNGWGRHLDRWDRYVGRGHYNRRHLLKLNRKGLGPDKYLHTRRKTSCPKSPQTIWSFSATASEVHSTRSTTTSRCKCATLVWRDSSLSGHPEQWCRYSDAGHAS